MLKKITFVLIVIKILQNTAEIVNDDDNDALENFDGKSFIDFGPTLAKSSEYFAIHTNI